MIKAAPYRKAQYDEWLERSINSVDDHITKKDDDFFFLIIGETGSGKSNLGLHIIEQYLKKDASVDYIGLNKSSIAEAFKKATDKPRPRCVFLDEANVSKREALSKFNKEMIDLYAAIRGLNMLHLWCNPSLDMIDKPFIEERIKGIFYCCTKGKTARYYYYFRTAEILQILNKYGNLKLPLIRKIRRKYAYYRGWFKKYDGFLLDDYLNKKTVRMTEKVEEFFHNWSTENDKDLINRKELKKYLGVQDSTIINYVKILEEKEIIQEGVNVFTYPNGRKKFKKTLLDDFSKLSKDLVKKQTKNLKKG